VGPVRTGTEREADMQYRQKVKIKQENLPLNRAAGILCKQ